LARRLSIAAKFFLTHLVIAGIALFIAGAVGFFLVRNLVMADADESLLARAHIVAETFQPLLAAPSPNGERIAREGDRIGKEIGARITVVLPDGTVVADSTVGAAGVRGMENHALHPEIRDALSGTTGVSLRRSITVREEQRYAALPISIGGTIIGAARASVPAATLTRRLWQITGIIWGTGLFALLLVLGGAAFMARRVTGPLAEMQAAAKEMGAGNLARRAQVRTGDEFEKMANAMNRMASHLAGTIRQLDAGKARLETLLANLGDGVIVIAADRSVRMMNREAEKIFDASETMGAGRAYPEVIRHPRTLAFIDGWIRGEEPKPQDLSIVTRQGSRTIRCFGTTVWYHGESDADVLLTLRDVTEERRLSQVKSDFVSNASHELRTPLTNIRGYLEAIQDTLREGAAPESSFVDVALGNALRMERLIDDLLELSRAESGAVPLEKEETSLSAFLSRVADQHRSSAKQAGKTLEVEALDGAFRADLRKLALALSNLVDNALKYGKEGGRVTLFGRIEGDACLLEVADDGPGISPEHLPRIFERFYRIDKGRSRELGGTGLGLSITKHIVESHGGILRVESRIGVGTRFVLRFPADPALPSRTSPSSSRDPHPGGSSR
jgi:two-component system phosphate regulon sensor histidine kinase PhoR